MRASVFLLSLWSMALGGCAGAGPAPTSSTPAPAVAARTVAEAPRDTRDPLAVKLDAVLADYAKGRAHAPGCAVGVYRAGETVFAKGYGLANLEHDAPITPSTVFEIASLSKQLTATAVLLLVADGKLSLGDDVRKYIPELPAYGRAITLRHLLAHTGGLREYDALLDLSGYDLADVATEDEALRLLTLQRAPLFPAGSRWSYSNSGYFLLSIVVKRVSGASLAAFSRARIFGPLGMAHTTILDDHTKVIPHRATAYGRRADGSLAVAMSGREATGEGNVHTSIEDLAKWDGAFYDPALFGAPWLAAMRTPGALDDGTPVKYAMGLLLGTTAGVAFEDHSGEWAGYRADLRRYPSERLTVAVLCNDADAEPSALAEDVAAAVAPKLAAPAAPPPPATRPVTPPATLSDAELAAVVGTYVDPTSLRVRTLAASNGGVVLGATPGPDAPPPVKLTAVDAHTFRAPGGATEYRIEPPRGGAKASLVRTSPHEPPRSYVRVDAVTLDAKALAAYAGRYRSDETTRDLEIAVAPRGLARAPWGKNVAGPPMAPVMRDAFAEGESFAMQFERDARGKVVGAVMYLDGYKALRWTKVP